MKRAILIGVALLLCLMGTAWGETDKECLRRYVETCPVYYAALGNTTAKEFANLVNQWCTENPPEKEKTIRFIPGYPQNIMTVEPDEILIYSGEKSKPCHWEYMYLYIPAPGSAKKIFPVDPGWHLLEIQPARAGQRLWFKREVCE